jgi:hypothetical protein
MKRSHDEIYGVRIRNKVTGEIKEQWFKSIDIRDRWLLFYSKDHYEVVEYLADQQEFYFNDLFNDN